MSHAGETSRSAAFHSLMFLLLVFKVRWWVYEAEIPFFECVGGRRMLWQAERSSNATSDGRETLTLGGSGRIMSLE